MNTLLKSAVIAATMLSSTVAHAGGPVIIEEGNDEVIAEAPASKGALLPVLGLLVLVCLMACGSDDEPVKKPQ